MNEDCNHENTGTVTRIRRGGRPVTVPYCVDCHSELHPSEV